jgi:hypothetical protein
MRAKFIASRQITVTDPTLVAQIRSLISDKTEFFANLTGYMTTTVREDKGQTKWYDNQIVTELEVLS